MGSCEVEIHEEEPVTTQVILGTDGDLPLLAAVTLEEAGLMLDPLQRRLIPMRVLVPTIMVANDTTSGAT
ncbi:hypothetical protein AYO38_00190 [bacterium SCGC AG-212-C10]|nr:hypothetical protein AYO38_00190 [bacterium SCGC AG-212-C10]